MKGMGNLMKQAQKLQGRMLKLQEELASRTVETAAGGGMVSRPLKFLPDPCWIPFR